MDRQLSVVDELEKFVVINLKRADKLRQSILKQAFEGKLVPQDPTDEPASHLLDRIRKQRQQAATQAQATPKRNPRKAKTTQTANAKASKPPNTTSTAQQLTLLEPPS